MGECRRRFSWSLTCFSLARIRFDSVLRRTQNRPCRPVAQMCVKPRLCRRRHNLGFHHRLVRSDGRRPGKRVIFLARWPSNKAMQHARDRIRELTDRSRLLLPVEAIVGSVNRFVRGWAAYFRYGNSTRHFDKIKGYMRMRLALVISKRHKRSRGFGRSVVFFQSPNYLGLVGLDGIVAAPRPFRAWRVTPNARR